MRPPKSWRCGQQLQFFCFCVVYTYKHIYLHTRALSGQHSDPWALRALEPFFGDFSVAGPRLVARLAPGVSPQPRGPCPRAGTPLPRPSRSASEVARSRLRSLPHAPQSQPCFFTTTSLSGSAYSPAVTLFSFLCRSLGLDYHDLRAGAAAAVHNISAVAEKDAWDVYCCCCSWLLLFLSFRLRCFGYGCWLRCCLEI